MATALDKASMKRLAEAVRWSYQRLQPFRENAREVVRQYVGYNYSDDGTDDRVPINMMELASNIFATQLAANTPRALVSTKHAALKVSAADLEIALNHLLGEIDLKTSIHRAVANAIMYPWGILKIGLGTAGEIEIDGVLHDLNQPFVDVVEFENYICDMSAMSEEEKQFEGNIYRLPYDEVKGNKSYDGPGQEDLKPEEYTHITATGDESIIALSVGEDGGYGSENTYREMVQLLDLWLPADGVVVTVPWDFADSVSPENYLRLVEWSGPEPGPYAKLSFNEVPGNLMPLSPAATWMDLHTLLNTVFRKLGRQAERQKTVVGYQGDASDDAKRIKDASDGDLINMNNPAGVNEIRQGGADQVGLAFSIHVKDLCSYMFGNLDVLGGLSPQSDTLGQDRLLAASASKRLGSMADATVTMAQKVIESLAYWLWTDPLIELPMVKRIPGLEGFEIESRYTPESREGDYLDYNFKIEPYSMQHKSPGDRLMSIDRLFGKYLANPLVMQSMMEQGIGVDAEGLIRLVAKYEDMDELEELLMFMNSSGPDERGPIESLRPGVTHRTTERINRPGATRPGRDQIMIQALTGGGQPAEVASLGRTG